MRIRALLKVFVPALVITGCGDSMDDALPLDQYATFRLTADLSTLTENERQMIPILIDAAKEMDEIFWQQAWGNADSLLESIDDPGLRRLVEANYGPWDRLNGDAPLLPGVAEKPLGAGFYPGDATREELEAAFDTQPNGDELRSLYTLVGRSETGFIPIAYHEAFPEPTQRAAALLREAAELAEDAGLRRYLESRAEALLTDDYRESDLAWMDMKTNTIDVVIGPIETYEDLMFGNKASHEAYVLIKDQAWSERLSRYAALLPSLQEGLPVPAEYKREIPGTDSELNAYDVIYYAGEANAGSKTIAINLPNDETVQLEKGTRRLQLKNAMQAKFDSILIPISEMLIAEDQRRRITFDAFFANTMFHEVAHGLGIKNTLTGQGTVREALQEHASAMEEGKADILGLYMITELYGNGELTEGDIMDNYVTFMASIFRSVRFGATSAHGRANMVRFSFFQELGAFTRDDATGTYRVDFDRMQEAMTALSEVILTLQGDGDYEGAGQLLSERGVITDGLRADLDRLTTAGIPVDIVFEQGLDVLNIDR
ncbi:MAG: Zn-dependent hydrolase [Gemmatimonadetes bacterium]|nr:Zn-dependent hydrolase [Gemmatimonadota bacterium]